MLHASLDFPEVSRAVYRTYARRRPVGVACRLPGQEHTTLDAEQLCNKTPQQIRMLNRADCVVGLVLMAVCWGWESSVSEYHGRVTLDLSRIVADCSSLEGDKGVFPMGVFAPCMRGQLRGRWT